jgi:eukaryotic-like serine/threonine-protein kinase
VKLKSEHVARVLDVATLDSGSPYIVMEHLEGQDLAHLLAERGVLLPDEAVGYVLQASDAIAEAHSLGIIHRDLKPGNLFVTRGRDGAPLVKVLDFGISKVNVLGDKPESMTNSAALLGSPLYMSPEQMKSSRDVGPATDIWSLGVILYEALGGRVPFDEQTMGALMATVLTQAPPSLAALQGQLPPELVGVVERCLEKDPASRYTSVAELVVALAPFGPPSSEERVARIVAFHHARSLLPSSIPIPASSKTKLSQSGATLRDHPSLLGVAATQALPGLATTGAAISPPKRRLGLYASAGVATLLVVGVALLGARAVRDEPAADRPASSGTAAAANAPPPTPPHPVTSAPTPAASVPPVDSSPLSATSSSAAASPTTTPAHVPGATSAPRQNSSTPTAPNPKRPVAPIDPFGLNRQ